MVAKTFRFGQNTQRNNWLCYLKSNSGCL